MKNQRALLVVVVCFCLLGVGCMSHEEQMQALAAVVKESQAESNAILFIQQAATDFYRQHGQWPPGVDDLRPLWKTAPDLSAFERVALTPTASGSLNVSLVRPRRAAVTFELHAPAPEKPNKAPEPTPTAVTPRANDRRTK